MRACSEVGRERVLSSSPVPRSWASSAKSRMAKMAACARCQHRWKAQYVKLSVHDADVDCRSVADVERCSQSII